MELLRTAKGDIEIYRYYSLNLNQTHYFLINRKLMSFPYRKERKIADVTMDGAFDSENESYFLIKTIPASQLKLMVLLKPDMTIEELLDEENKLFECS